jgi:hypothetical protein
MQPTCMSTASCLGLPRYFACDTCICAGDKHWDICELAGHAGPMRAPAAGFDALPATSTLQASIAANPAQLTAQLAALPTEAIVVQLRGRGMLPPTAGSGQPTRAEAMAWLAERVARAPPLHPEVAKDLAAIDQLLYAQLAQAWPQLV